MNSSENENDSEKELRFHLKELYWDLTSLVKQAEALSVIVFGTAQSFRSLRYGLEGVLSGIEHDASHHLAEALKLTGHVTEKPSLVTLGERLASLEMKWNDENRAGENIQTDSVSSLTIRLQEFLSELRLAREAIVQTAWSPEETQRGLEQLDYGLEQVAQALADRAWVQAEDLYRQAHWLHRAADPESAAQEDYWQLLATPLQEENHPLARSLDACPRCGAVLTGEDRTFDGSYCESCRTRWIQAIAAFNVSD